MNEETIEQWKSIPNFPEYECSDLGRVRNKRTKRVRKTYIRYSNYIKHCLNGKGMLEHRLVALTWLENPDNKPTVNHKNHITTDNRVVNLEWATYKEQNNDKNKSNGFNTRGTKVLQFDLDGNFLREFDSVVEAGRFIGKKYAHKCISNTICGTTKSGCGFVWKYKEIELIEDELWEEIQLCKELGYFISNLGRIKQNNILIELGENSNGYKHISMGSRSEKKVTLLHRLVAEHFIPNPDNKPFVNHKDGNKLNNSVENLEWCTCKENNQHAIDSGLRSYVKKIILYNNEDNSIIQIFNSAIDASKILFLEKNSILRCCHGTRKCYKNNYFKFLDESDDLINMKIKNKPEIIKLNNTINVYSKKKGLKINVYKNSIFIETCKSIKEVTKKYKKAFGCVKDHCEGRVKHPTKEYTFTYF